jgi:hypothetical protein
MLFCLVISGCDFGGPLVILPPEVTPYYAEFIEIIGVSRQTAGIIEISQITSDNVAQCNVYPKGPWLLQLNSLYWGGLSVLDRRATVYHELTHCIFNSQTHSNDPNSYMYFAMSTPKPKFILDDQVREYTKNL